MVMDCRGGFHPGEFAEPPVPGEPFALVEQFPGLGSSEGAAQSRLPVQRLKGDAGSCVSGGFLEEVGGVLVAGVEPFGLSGEGVVRADVQPQVDASDQLVPLLGGGHVHL